MSTKRSTGSYPTQVPIGSITGQATETLIFIIITISAVTTNMKSQSTIEKPIDQQTMILIQVQ